MIASTSTLVFVGSLADRLRFVIDQNWVESARAWSLKAGLAAQQVSTYLSRAADNPEADMERGAVVALAKAARISPAWLATDEGSPRGDESGRLVEHYVCARIREVRRDHPALRHVAAELGVDVATIRHVWGGGNLGEAGLKTWQSALGAMSVEGLRDRAAEWWRLRGQRLHALVLPSNDSNDARAEGNAMARSWGTTDQDVLAVLEATEGTGPQPTQWWYERFMAEMKRRIDADQHEELVALPVKRRKQAVTRAAHKQRKEGAEKPASRRSPKKAVGEK